jgi:hypothetical protein
MAGRLATPSSVPTKDPKVQASRHHNQKMKNETPD